MLNLDNCLAKLTKSGFRVTQPRKKLLKLILERKVPFTADEIYDQVKGQGMGRATVFRTFKLLYDLQVLVRVHLEEGCQHYQIAAGDFRNPSHHDRIVCRQCGAISYLDECPIKDNVFHIAQRSGYKLSEFHLDLYGVCFKCENKVVS